MKWWDRLTGWGRLPVEEWPEIREREDRQRALNRRLERIKAALDALEAQALLNHMTNGQHEENDHQ